MYRDELYSAAGYHVARDGGVYTAGEEGYRPPFEPTGIPPAPGVVAAWT